MFVDLVLLVIFDMPAHYDDGLPHEEKEAAADQARAPAAVIPQTTTL